MVNKMPDVDPEQVFTVKETCAILGVCKDTIADRRKRGLIKPVNPKAERRFKYKGSAIIRLWKIENNIIKL